MSSKRNLFVLVLFTVSIGLLSLAQSAPVITNVSPSSAWGGDPVTITGSNFGASVGSSYVDIGGNRLTVTSWSDTQIQGNLSVNVTASATTVRANVGGTYSNSYTGFTTLVPVITGVNVGSAYAGTQITITGTSFGSSQGANAGLWIGAQYVVASSWTNTQIVATVPLWGQANWGLNVKQGQYSNVFPFTILIPQISSISPASATAGTQVTIAGSNFGATQGNGTLKLGACRRPS